MAATRKVVFVQGDGTVFTEDGGPHFLFGDRQMRMDKSGDFVRAFRHIGMAWLPKTKSDDGNDVAVYVEQPEG